MIGGTANNIVFEDARMDQSHADKTLVMTATYNEIENLPRLVEEVFRFAPQVEMLVIDRVEKTPSEN